MQYIPHYDRHTGIPMGSCPTANDILARSNMIREAGLVCSGETWDPGNGNVPVYSGPELDDNSLQVMCLKRFVERTKKDEINEMLEAYRNEYARVNGSKPYVVQDGNFWVEINGSAFKLEMIPRAIATLKERPDYIGK